MFSTLDLRKGARVFLSGSEATGHSLAPAPLSRHLPATFLLRKLTVSDSNRLSRVSQSRPAISVGDNVGEGVMGDLCNARDSRLDRFVAIKQWPESMLASAG